MAAPKLSLGQQVVVVNRTNGDYVATVKTAQVVSGEWRYGVFTAGDEATTTFVYVTELSHKLVDGNWTPLNSQQRVAL